MPVEPAEEYSSAERGRRGDRPCSPLGFETFGKWSVETYRDPISHLHSLGYPEPRGLVARIHEPTDAALVLGSTQSASDLFSQIPEVQIVRRMSGGGAVMVAPDNLVWIDFEIPADSELFKRDFGDSFLVVSEIWQRALEKLGQQVTVYRGETSRDDYSRRICFAGKSCGELFIGNAKLVGMSQRRTRAGALIQSAILLDEQFEWVEELGLPDSPPSGINLQISRRDLINALVDTLSA